MNYLDTSDCLSVIKDLIEEYGSDFNQEELLTKEHVEKLIAFLTSEDDSDEELEEDVKDGLKFLTTKLGHIKESKGMFKLIK